MSSVVRPECFLLITLEKNERTERKKIFKKWALLEAIPASHSCLSLGGDESPAGDQTQPLLQVTPDFWGSKQSWEQQLGTPEGVQCCLHTGSVSLEGNIQACSAHQRSHQGLPGFWRRGPAPPSISNYTCWSRRAKSHLVFELPKKYHIFYYL